MLVLRPGAVATAFLLVILAQPMRSLETTARSPVACNAPLEQPEWRPLHHLRPSALPCGALRTARSDLESAEREVQAMRRT